MRSSAVTAEGPARERNGGEGAARTSKRSLQEFNNNNNKQNGR